MPPIDDRTASSSAKRIRVAVRASGSGGDAARRRAPRELRLIAHVNSSTGIPAARATCTAARHAGSSDDAGSVFGRGLEGHLRQADRCEGVAEAESRIGLDDPEREARQGPSTG